MANSALSVDSSLIVAPVPSRAGVAPASARAGAAPTGAFASLLDQLGQPLTASVATAATAPASDAASATLPAAINQPQAPTPPPSIPPAAPLQTASPLQSAAVLSAPNPQPPDASAATGPKTADKKAKPDLATDADPLPLIAVAETTAANPAVPLPVLTPVPAPTQSLPTAGPTLKAAPELAAAPPISANPPSSASDIAPATAVSASAAPPPPAAAPASTKNTPTTASEPSAEVPTSSRMADQAAAATQAGLSVDDDRQERAVPPEPATEPQRAPAATSQVDQTPPSPPTPLTAPQLASLTIPATAVPPATPTRNGAPAPAPARTSVSDATPPSPTPSNNIGTGTQPSPSPPPDVQALTPTSLPPTAPITTAATASTRPTQVAPPASPSPAAQVAQAIAEPVKVVLTSPAQAGLLTPHVTTIQITPVELGRVEVRIERTDDGPAKIQLIAERPETLSRLVHDQSQLQQALDHAGIPQNSRTIEFSLAPTAPDTSNLASNWSGNNTSNGEPSGNGFQRQNNAYYHQNFGDPDNGDVASATQTRVVRTGIDITA